MDSEMGIVAGILGFLGIFFLIIIAVAVLMIIAQFKVFKKGGEEGWKAIIPIYNQYTLCQIVGLNPNWIWIILVLGLLSAVPLVGLVSTVASIYFTVLLNVSVARSFGKDTGFAIGLILVPVIFWPILAFGSSEFVGQNPMDDFVMSKINKNNTNTNTTQQTPVQQAPVAQQQAPVEQAAPQASQAFCTNCGAPIADNAEFCTSCGTKRN